MTTKIQHYVWRNYLKTWAPQGNIFCLRNGNVFETGLTRVGQEKYFYKLKELTDEEIEAITILGIQGTNPILKNIQEDILKIFTHPFDRKKQLEAQNTPAEEIQKEIDPLIIDTEENYQGYFEKLGIKYLNLILQKDISFYDRIAEKTEFLPYLCVQYSRTKKIKESVLAATATQSTVDVEKIWNPLSHMYAAAVGFNINRMSEYKLILLVNNTSYPFITGDQPILNTFVVNKPANAPVDDLELYYPVSPEIAVLLTRKEEFRDVKQVTINSVDEVKMYNKYIVEESLEQIYSNKKEVLEEIAKVGLTEAKI